MPSLHKEMSSFLRKKNQIKNCSIKEKKQNQYQNINRQTAQNYES